MDEIDNCDDSSAQATDGVESSEKKTDSGDEESSRDSRDTGGENDDPLSLPFCVREISGKSYNLTTWMDELGSFPAKLSVVHPYLIPIVHDDNFSAPTVDDEILLLAVVDDDLATVDAYFAEEVDEELN
uniref:Uncharacterized protein n=1 Tax=Solanum tuberosum TaxID=4113 RepID=M1DCK7_SOLTU